MAHAALISTQEHIRGFKGNFNLGEPTVRELLKQVQMLTPDNLAFAANLAAYKKTRYPAQR